MKHAGNESQSRMQTGVLILDIRCAELGQVCGRFQPPPAECFPLLLGSKAQRPSSMVEKLYGLL